MPLVFLCTTFLLQSGNHVVVAKSYDWDMSHGLVDLESDEVTSPMPPGVVDALASYPSRLRCTAASAMK